MIDLANDVPGPNASLRCWRFFQHSYHLHETGAPGEIRHDAQLVFVAGFLANERKLNQLALICFQLLVKVYKIGETLSVDLLDGIP